MGIMRWLRNLWPDRLRQKRRARRERKLIAESGLFDAKWYLSRYKDVAAAGVNPLIHYLKSGAHEGRDPNPDFDSDWYLERYPDVAAAGVNPLAHYAKWGRSEGRATKPYPYKPAREIKAAIATYRRKRKAGNRVAVFQAIVGNYDQLRVPEVLDSAFDYFVFADRPQPSYGVFETRPMPYGNGDATRVARYVKTHPHILLTDHDIAVWVDANIMVRHDLAPYIERLLASDSPVGGLRHSDRDCVYDEAEACIKARKDDPARIKAQIERYEKEGMPRKYGMIETGLVIWNLRHPAAEKILDAWWQEIETGSRRDQLSLGYVMWRHQEKWLLLDPEMTLRFHPGLPVLPHGIDPYWPLRESAA